MSIWHIVLGYFTVGICMSVCMTSLVYASKKREGVEWERGDNLLALAFIPFWLFIVFIWIRAVRKL